VHFIPREVEEVFLDIVTRIIPILQLEVCGAGLFPTMLKGQGVFDTLLREEKVPLGTKHCQSHAESCQLVAEGKQQLE
jgi:hypothetical protein